MKAPIRAVTTDGVQWLADLNDQERSIVGRHDNAIRDYLEEGDDSRLGVLEFDVADPDGKIRVGGHELLLDRREIERLAARGTIRFESIYEDH